MDASRSIDTIEVKSANFVDKDALFTHLSQRSGLTGLEIDLDPGVALLPLLSGPDALPLAFASLKRASIMCYPEVALSLPKHFRQIEDLQLEIARIPDSLAQPTDFTIFEDMIAELSHCPKLRLLKIVVGLLAVDFPSSAILPRLTGAALSKLAETCSNLEDLNLLATEPFAINGSTIHSEDFDNFCKHLPHLRNLSLKFHSATTSVLQTTALQSLGKHCPEIEVIRLKVAFDLPSLPVPNAVPHILISSDGSTPELPSSHDVQPLFHKLTHLALSRPDTALAPIPDTFASSVSSHSTSVVVDPSIEEELVRTWAHSLLTHFPRIEILEAWGDSSGQDNESLNYFLPTQEPLASTWEFLSGIEQDLWEDDEEEVFEEDDSWNSLEDWEKASLMNEVLIEEEGGYLEDVEIGVGKLAMHDEEPDNMLTPVKLLKVDGYFE